MIMRTLTSALVLLSLLAPMAFSQIKYLNDEYRGDLGLEHHPAVFFLDRFDNITWALFSTPLLALNESFLSFDLSSFLCFFLICALSKRRSLRNPSIENHLFGSFFPSFELNGENLS